MLLYLLTIIKIIKTEWKELKEIELLMKKESYSFNVCW